MLPQELNANQLRLLTNYVSGVVQNNQEAHPSDMPAVIEMFKLLAERNYYLTYDQIDSICEELHSSGNYAARTSEALREYLKQLSNHISLLCIISFTKFTTFQETFIINCK